MFDQKIGSYSMIFRFDHRSTRIAAFLCLALLGTTSTSFGSLSRIGRYATSIFMRTQVKIKEHASNVTHKFRTFTKPALFKPSPFVTLKPTLRTDLLTTTPACSQYHLFINLTDVFIESPYD